MNNEDTELYVVTEVGTFGELNIDDPTKKKLKRKDEDIMSVIKEATEINLSNIIPQR